MSNPFGTLLQTDRSVPEPEFRTVIGAMLSMAGLAQLREDALAEANKRLRDLGEAPVVEVRATEPPARPMLALLNARVDLPPHLFAVVLPTEPPEYAAFFRSADAAAEWATKHYRVFAVYHLDSGELAAGRDLALKTL